MPPLEVRRTQISSALSTAAAREKGPSKWKAAISEAQFAASGLIARPAESTRHFTIIRHSSGLVWYRGSNTSLVVTVLADQPLPPNRTLWLQEKGYSGNTGMSLKALVGSRGNWIHVTPALEAQVQHIPETEEREIQRDIKRFVKKADGRTARHVARETHLVRIPASASDGYFRLVLCGGENPKSTLCGSPIFRVASTSPDGAVVRGASLTTMPIEMGVKLATTVGTQVVKRYTGVAGAVVQSQAVKRVATPSVTKAAAVAYKGYRGAGGGGLQTAMQESWQKNRLDGRSRLINETVVTSALHLVGPEDGPEPPFPIKFSARTSSLTGHLLPLEIGAASTVLLEQVPDHVQSRLPGVFAAWATVIRQRNGPTPDQEWHEAIVTIAPLRSAQPSIVMTNTVSVCFATGNLSLSEEHKVQVLLMGYLHPAAGPAATSEQLILQHRHDVSITLASLGRENWAPQETIRSIKTLKSARSFGDRLNEATGRMQQAVDRIPLHLAGVRSESGRARDDLVGVGGIWIRRDGGYMG